MRQKRKITESEKAMLLHLEPDDVNKDVLNSLFTDRYDTIKKKIVPSQFNPYDEFTLKKGENFNKADTLTTCGQFIFNKFVIEPTVKDITGYITMPLSGGNIKKIDGIIAVVLQDDPTTNTAELYIDYLDRLSWLAFSFNTEICSSITLKAAKPLPAVMKRKEELLKKYDAKLKNVDIPTYTKIQDELISVAQKELADDPSMELYASGARGAFDNAYRQALIIKGPVYNAANNNFEIMTNSLYEGANKTDLATFANAVVSGMYPKAIGTAVSGYMAKRISALLQHIKLKLKGSDCGSKGWINVELTPETINMYLYNYMVEKSGLVRLDTTNKSKYVGKTVKMRLPSVCTDKLCNVCAGDRYYMLGIETVGLTGNRVANSMLNAGMKRSHDTTVRTYKVDENKIFLG